MDFRPLIDIIFLFYEGKRIRGAIKDHNKTIEDTLTLNDL